MDLGLFISNLNPWVLFGLVIVFCVVCAEAGARTAELLIRKGIKEPETPVGTAVGALLGLLAFMLGFTFSITASRFADRKALTINQANAIGTSYLRTSYLPEPQKQQIRKYYHEYVDLLLYKIYPDDKIDLMVKRVEKIHILIWKQTASLAKEDLDSELRSLFTASVNEVIEVGRERKTVAMVFRIPGVIWFSLFLLAALGMFSVGYQTGTHGSRRTLDLPVLAAAFALVILMIANMDSSGPTRFKVNLQPYIDLERMMEEDLP